MVRPFPLEPTCKGGRLMSQFTNFFSESGKNIVRAEVTIVGVRPLLQHAFGPDTIPLEKLEREGVTAPGNDPNEWKRSMLVTSNGQLYVRNDYVFGCLKKGATRTKKGRGSIQADVEATLEVDPAVILLEGCFLPENVTRDPTQRVYIDVRGATVGKSRHVRYRLAASPGWECSFTLQWDKTIVSRNQMQTVLRDAGMFGGLGDGLKLGMGRFTVIAYKEITNNGEETTEGVVEDSEGEDVEQGQEDLCEVPEACKVDGVPH